MSDDFASTSFWSKLGFSWIISWIKYAFDWAYIAWQYTLGNVFGAVFSLCIVVGTIAASVIEALGRCLAELRVLAVSVAGVGGAPVSAATSIFLELVDMSTFIACVGVIAGLAAAAWVYRFVKSWIPTLS